jgi:N-hydroxyarylamine O-acetyltransferase
LRENVLEKLGCAAPEPTLEGLARVYAAWCQKVPFDNVRKLIHVRRNDSATLPGDNPQDFFEAWLAYGCGGTCWAGNGALQALLTTLGFAAERAVATMLVTPDLPPNHGSVVVTIDGNRWVVDASILHGEPLPMRAEQPATIDHPAWGVTAHWLAGQFRIRWRNFMTNGQPLDCGFNHIGASAQEFSERHEMTRGWSPFNFGLCLNLLRGQRRIGAAMGLLASFDEHGHLEEQLADDIERRRFLIEEAGMSEELVSRLPEDIPFQAPPR